MKTLISLIFIILFVTAAQTSVLSSLAAALPERTWVKLPDNASLNGFNIHWAYFYFTDSGVWDPVRKQVAWIGACGVSNCNPSIYKRLAYDAAGDAWTFVTTPFSGAGHGYDGNALDPGTGLHYFAWWRDNNIRTWDGSNWGTLPAYPLDNPCCKALSWFPDINGGKGGLVVTSNDGEVAWFNGQTWTLINGAQAAPWGDYELFSEYNPVHKLVWMGGGNVWHQDPDYDPNRAKVNYTLDAQLRLTRKKDAPFSLKACASLKSCDPVSGKYIVYDFHGQAWWEYDVVNDSWSQITNMNAEPDLGENSAFHVPIPEYGVIMIFKQKNSTRSVYLYRHTAGSVTAKNSHDLSMSEKGIQVTPNPFKASISIFLSDAKKANVAVYDINGKMVKAFSDSHSSNELSWNALGQPAGVYVIRAEFGSSILSKKMFLAK
jgi:hypothetical protein